MYRQPYQCSDRQMHTLIKAVSLSLSVYAGILSELLDFCILIAVCKVTQI